MENGTRLLCWWECKMLQLLWETFGSASKTKQRIAMWPSNFTPRQIKELETGPERSLVGRCLSRPHSQQPKDGIDPSVHQQTLWYTKCTQNELLFSCQKEWSFDTCYNRDELRKHAKWGEPGAKGQISLHLCKISRVSNLTEKVDQGLPGAEVGGNGE